MTLDLARFHNTTARAVDVFGAEPQLRMLQEECAELIAAVNQYFRARQGSESSLVEEVADATIMLAQARKLLGNQVDRAIERKLDRLEMRLDAKERAR